MQIIYADVVFAVNSVVNYLILIASAKICSAVVSRWRLLGAAAIGGLYAVLASLPPLLFLTSPAVIAAAGLLVITAAFGGQTRIARIALVFFSVSAAFAGAVYALSLMGGVSASGVITPMSIGVLVPAFAVCYAVVILVFRATAGGKGGIEKLSVTLGKKTVELTALVDTGNTLKDPISGMPVIIAGISELENLFPPEVSIGTRELERDGAAEVMRRLAAVPIRFRLIPYNAVGIAGGMLLAFKPDSVTVGGVSKNGMLVALSPNSVTDNGTYSALIGA